MPPWGVWRSFCPVLRGQAPTAYQAEPYVMPGNVDGPLSPTPGRAGWTWYTGSGQWYLRSAIEGVLGIEARLEGLRVDSALPAGWDGFHIRRVFRGATYEIQVRRAADGESPGCRVDGAEWDAEFLPIAPQGSNVRVELLV